MSLHAMIDLETFALQPDAMISTVGVALFDPFGDGVEESFEWRLSMYEQWNSRRMDPDTISWWMKQGDEARQRMFGTENRQSLDNFCHNFCIDHIPWPTIQGVWSHGAGFDLPILEHFLRQQNRTVPWHYQQARDTRTVFWLAGMDAKDLVKAEIKHSAQHDAIAQALSVQFALKLIKHDNSNFPS